MAAMVSRILEQEDVIRAVLGSDRKMSHLIPRWQDIDVLESLAKALSPVSELTDFLSGEKHITISSVIPIIHNLATKVLVDEEDDTELTKTIKHRIIDDLKHRYENEDLKNLLSIATFLDPRFKADYTKTEVEKELLIDSVLDVAMEDFDNVIDESSEQLSTTCSSTEPQPPTKKRKVVTFLTKSVVPASAPASSRRETIQKELQSYLLCPNLNVESEITPLRWWKEHADQFPIVSKVAKKYLCMCATSTSSERLFSTSGNIATPIRAALKPEKVNMLVFLAKNLD